MNVPLSREDDRHVYVGRRHPAIAHLNASSLHSVATN